MSTQRLSLSSPAFAGRIKKYDTYRHDPRTSQRASLDIGKIKLNIAPIKSQHSVSNDGIYKTIAKQTTLKLPQDKLIKQEQFGTSQKLVFGLKSTSNSTVAKNISNSKQNIAHTPKDIVLSAVSNAKNVVDLNPTFDESNIIEKQFSSAGSTVGREKLSFKKKLLRMQTLFYSLGTAVFIFASFVSVQAFLNNKYAKQQLGVLGEQTWTTDEQGVAEGTSEEPSEAEVPTGAIASYKVNPELPRYLRIPDISVYARIKNTGVTKTGAVAAPSNINDVSWFNESALPGNPIGASLLLGHVSGWSAPGIFKNIDKLKNGSRIEIEKGSGEKLVYEVTNIEKVAVDSLDMSKVLAPDEVGKHDLKLITCGGRYNHDTKEYEERVIVHAKILR